MKDTYFKTIDFIPALVTYMKLIKTDIIILKRFFVALKIWLYSAFAYHNYNMWFD